MDIDKKVIEQIVRSVVEKTVSPGSQDSGFQEAGSSSPGEDMPYGNNNLGAISNNDIERLININSPTICNGIESFKVRDETDGYATSELKCMRPELKPMVGFAITVSVDSTTPASLEKPRFFEKFCEILNLIKNSSRPSIAIFKDVGPQRDKCCVTGDLLASSFASVGAVGLVTDSCIRDLIGIRENAKDFQVFAAGQVVSHGLPNILEIGGTINICGLTIKPDDLLHGDDSGLVKIPVNYINISQLIERCEKNLFQEKQYFDYMKSGKYSFEGMKKLFKQTVGLED